MCGIAGLFRTQRLITDVDRDETENVLNQMKNRGPDGGGIFTEGHVILGHRRLKIIDLTEAGRQPMISHCGRFALVFNGEIYNYEELRKELGDREWRSKSDTEVLLEAWAKWGADCLPRLVGQFAFAVYDRSQQTIVLVRDRFGEKPLFYHEDEAGLSFASSLSALLKNSHIAPELDADAVEEYITMRYVVAPNTIVKDVKKLLPGALLTISELGTTTEQWYRLTFQSEAAPLVRRSKAALVEEFDTLFQQAVRRCSVSDVPMGLLLSDGIDSQSIATVAKNTAMPTFTYGYQHGQAKGSGLYRESVGNRNASFSYSFTSDERVAGMKEAFGSLTEPVGDGASLATWLLLKEAKRDSTVFLCGHGADEILGGYRLSQDRFRLSTLKTLSHLPTALTRKPLDRYLFGHEPLNERIKAFRSCSKAQAPSAARYINHRPLPMADANTLLGRPGDAAPPSYLNVVKRLYAAGSVLSNDLDQMQEVMIQTFLSANILSFADSVAMSASVEVRMPFLDRDLADFVFKLPKGARVGDWPGRANTKMILRWWGQGRLPQDLLRQSKKSFDFGSLRSLMGSHESEIKGYILNSKALCRVLPGVESWLQNPSSYFRGCWQGTLWALLSLGIWCEANGIS